MGYSLHILWLTPHYNSKAQASTSNCRFYI